MFTFRIILTGSVRVCMYVALLLTINDVYAVSQCNSSTKFRGASHNAPLINDFYHNNRRHSGFPPLLSHHVLAMIPSGKPTGNHARHGASNVDLGGKGDSRIKYFGDLLSGLMEDISGQKFDTYANKCEQTRLVLAKAFGKLLHKYNTMNIRPEMNKSSANTKPGVNEEHYVESGGSMLENALVATIARFIDMTKDGVPDNSSWFFSANTAALNDNDKHVRLNGLIRLILMLETHMYTAFREFVASHKLSFVSRMFVGSSDSVMQLTEQRFVKQLQRDYAAAVQNLLPKCFKLSDDGEKAVKELLVYISKAEPGVKEFLTILKQNNIDQELSGKLIQRMRRWNVVADVDEFSELLTKLSNCAKENLQRHLNAAAKQSKLLDVLSSQQQQIDIYQKQLGMQSQNYSPLSYGFSYRMPNTNFNITGSYQRGKGNVQISCVPDESARLLGPYGFTSGVFPGNLGLSINIDV